MSVLIFILDLSCTYTHQHIHCKFQEGQQFAHPICLQLCQECGKCPKTRELMNVEKCRYIAFLLYQQLSSVLLHQPHSALSPPHYQEKHRTAIIYLEILKTSMSRQDQENVLEYICTLAGERSSAVGDLPCHENTLGDFISPHVENYCYRA